MPFRYSLKQGFTLVELLVVIGIIAVLSTILLLQLGTARSKTRDTARIAHISQLRGAIEQFLDDCGSYPRTTNFSGALACIGASTTKTMTTYISPLPTDPFGLQTDTTYDGAANKYNYVADSSNYPAKKYQISAELELFNKSAHGNDTDITTSDWSAGVGTMKPGATEACTTTADDCVFDLGIK